jgi:alpha-L-rhamnosidase
MRSIQCSLRAAISAALLCGASGFAGLTPTALRCEYLLNPSGIDETAPRLSWRVESEERGQRQTACRILVASTREKLGGGEGDLWDSGKLEQSETVGIAYHGQPLVSRMECHWKVQVWDKDGQESAWSAPARWSMGLLNAADWEAQWISYRDRDTRPLSREELHLPPARHYRKMLVATGEVKRATAYVSALGLYDWHVNGLRVGDAFFAPGWCDYKRRAFYSTLDLTTQIRRGTNVVGAVVADGWYAGYVGYGLLVGYGPNKAGRCFYGKTPALLAQIELEYADGSKETVGTDTTWDVTGDGPTREADLIMGESYDARLEDPRWCEPVLGTNAGPWAWGPAVLASDNSGLKAVFYDNCGSREIDLGFVAPPRLQAHPGVPVRATQELPAKTMTEPRPGTYIFDLGQNIAGVVRLKVRGLAGTKVQIRHGEMLHPDGRLMTENLRKARATDFYTLRGDAAGETWMPRFTYHGFRYVELTGLGEKPQLDAVTGVVLHSDTPLVSSFACSDEVLTRFWENGRWTQRANFIEVPTDCPQRDERLGWMGDAQAYIATACYNADAAAFFTKWMQDVEEAQRSFGAYPDYCPYPMGHGTPNKTFGTAWTDAGIICPWTLWRFYGDTRLVERHWASMTRFMDWRAASTSPEGLGTSLGNPWGDWLNVNESTPIEFIDTCYHALDCRLMAEMGEAIGRKLEAINYRRRLDTTAAAFRKQYLREEGRLTVDTQTAYVLALWTGLLPQSEAAMASLKLAGRIETNGFRMATGFLGTRALLPALSANGQHDLAVRLFQSRKFPSWAYEVINGATTVWERWDSYTTDHGFEGLNGSQNASMNSFSHYAFGAVMEWAFRDLAGISTEEPGYGKLLIRPRPPAPAGNPDQKPIDWVRAEYGSIRGPILTHWRQGQDNFELDLTIPANTTATVIIPATSREGLSEGGKPLDQVQGVSFLRMEGSTAVLDAASGRYRFASKLQ